MQWLCQCLLARCTQVVYHWAKGVPFKDICELTDVLEGAIVRTIVRLDETCRCGQPRSASLPFLFFAGFPHQRLCHMFRFLCACILACKALQPCSTQVHLVMTTVSGIEQWVLACMLPTGGKWPVSLRT